MSGIHRQYPIDKVIVGANFGQERNANTQYGAVQSCTAVSSAAHARVQDFFSLRRWSGAKNQLAHAWPSSSQTPSICVPNAAAIWPAGEPASPLRAPRRRRHRTREWRAAEPFRRGTLARSNSTGQGDDQARRASQLGASSAHIRPNMSVQRQDMLAPDELYPACGSRRWAEGRHATIVPANRTDQ